MASDTKRLSPTEIPEAVRRFVFGQGVWDVHTHLYPPTMGSPFRGAGQHVDPHGLMLWGIDELLTYHYLVAELFRFASPGELSYEAFWRMNKSAQADLIWRRLFCERSPLSEACRGVLTTLARLGLDPHESGLDGYRRWFAAAEPDGHVDRVMELAGIFSDGDEGSTHGVLLREVLLPLLAERGLPLAMMIGSTGAVNPGLGEAGHMVGRADIGSVTRLCADFPGNRFLVTLLSRENQYELAVLARKFRNLTIFGCWWYLNTPSLVREITRMRLELLGTGFIPQHSDARVLEQLVYKWEHSRAVIAGVLAEKYCDLAATGWPLTEKAIARDVQRLLCGNTAALLGGEADA